MVAEQGTHPLLRCLPQSRLTRHGRSRECGRDGRQHLSWCSSCLSWTGNERGSYDDGRERASNPIHSSSSSINRQPTVIVDHRGVPQGGIRSETTQCIEEIPESAKISIPEEKTMEATDELLTTPSAATKVRSNLSPGQIDMVRSYRVMLPSDRRNLRAQHPELKSVFDKVDANTSPAGERGDGQRRDQRPGNEDGLTTDAGHQVDCLMTALEASSGDAVTASEQVTCHKTTLKASGDEAASDQVLTSVTSPETARGAGTTTLPGLTAVVSAPINPGEPKDESTARQDRSPTVKSLELLRALLQEREFELGLLSCGKAADLDTPTLLRIYKSMERYDMEGAPFPFGKNLDISELLQPDPDSECPASSASRANMSMPPPETGGKDDDFDSLAINGQRVGQLLTAVAAVGSVCQYAMQAIQTCDKQEQQSMATPTEPQASPPLNTTHHNIFTPGPQLDKSQSPSHKRSLGKGRGTGEVSGNQVNGRSTTLDNAGNSRGDGAHNEAESMKLRQEIEELKAQLKLNEQRNTEQLASFTQAANDRVDAFIHKMDAERKSQLDNTPVHIA